MSILPNSLILYTPPTKGKQSRKRCRNVGDHEGPNAKKTDYWLGETTPTHKRFSALTDEILEDSPNQSTDPKPPPIFISGVANRKPLIELLYGLAPNKYLVKTLSSPGTAV
jgi:hypothetical protein